MAKRSKSPVTDSSSSDSSTPPTKKTKAAAATTTTTMATKPLEIAPPVSIPNNNVSESGQPIIILLDQARLETIKTRKGNFELLNCDDHRDLCRKLKQNSADHRPDICHQELLALLDSPLNKSGNLKLYLRTHKGVLIELHPSVRIPRTFKRFSGLMVQLLHKMKIKAGTTSTTLLKVVKNPFSSHLPAGTHVYGMSVQGTLYAPNALARTLVPETAEECKEGGKGPVCFVIGAMASGHIDLNDHPYIEKLVSVSEYPLSGAAAISRILGGIENHWGII